MWWLLTTYEEWRVHNVWGRLLRLSRTNKTCQKLINVWNVTTIFQIHRTGGGNASPLWILYHPLVFNIASIQFVQDQHFRHIYPSWCVNTMSWCVSKPSLHNLYFDMTFKCRQIWHWLLLGLNYITAILCLEWWYWLLRVVVTGEFSCARCRMINSLGSVV